MDMHIQLRKEIRWYMLGFDFNFLFQYCYLCSVYILYMYYIYVKTYVYVRTYVCIIYVFTHVYDGNLFVLY